MYDARLRFRTNRLLVVVVILATFIFMCYVNRQTIARSYFGKQRTHGSTVHLVAVSCGKPDYMGRKDIQKPFDQTLTMVKSAVLFARTPLHVHIFTEKDMKDLFTNEINTWPLAIRARFELTIYNAEYSEHLPSSLVEEWKKWYKPCGSFRLFLPMIMQNITEAAIYADSDVIFVKPIDILWNFLYEMDDINVAAISPTAGHPIGGSKDNVNFISHTTGLFQINSGVMLLNFHKILEADWKLFEDERIERKKTAKYGADLLLTYYKKFKGSAEHDQKLLNIMYHYNPEFLHQLPCAWNFKTNFCIDDKNICLSAEETGAGAVHGIAGGFFGSAHPTFRGLHETFLNYGFDADLESSIFEQYQKYLSDYTTGTYCGEKAHIITDSLRESINAVKRW